MPPSSRQKFVSAIKLARHTINQNEPFIDEFNENSDLEHLIIIKNSIVEGFQKVEAFLFEFEVNDQDLSDRAEILSEYQKIMAKINNLIKRFKPIDPVVLSSPPASVHSFNGLPAPINFKLPDISIPTFSGEISSWPRFRDLFKAIIIDQPNLSNVNKFCYLNSSLKGEAKNCISNLEICDQNFDLAWSILLKRYENPRGVIKIHLNCLLSPPVIADNSASSLRSFLDYFNVHVNALLNIKDIDLKDLLLVALVSKNLTSSLLKDWELHLGENNIPSYSELMDFLTMQHRALAAVEEPTAPQKSIDVSSSAKANVNPASNSKVISCLICNSAHNYVQCSTFKKWDPRQRSDFVKSKNCCLRCLAPRSKGHSCSVVCDICNKFHNISLHFGTSTATPAPKVDVVKSGLTRGFMERSGLTSTLIPTAIVDLSTSRSQPFHANAILDSGSEVSLISEDAARKLRLPFRKAQTIIVGAAGQEAVATRTVSTTVKSINSDWEKEVTFVIIPSISNVLNTAFSTRHMNIPDYVTLADAKFNEPKPMHILLGADVFFEVLSSDKLIPWLSNYPYLKETALGWLVAGPIPSLSDTVVSSKFCSFTQSRFDIHDKIEKFWALEHCGSSDTDVSEQDFCLEHFSKNVTRAADGRYCVRLPVLPDAPKIGSSQWQAKNRLLSLEKRFDRDPDLAIQYRKFISEYKLLGHMVKAPPPSGEEFLMPHFPVLKQDSTTTKLRVVFDGSAKSSTGVSLNDTLAIGPVVQDDLFSILLRFRESAVGITADIEKMYRQVSVNVLDQHLQHILWRDSPSDPIECWALTTVTYGTAPASFLATQSLIQLAADEGEKFPSGQATLLKDFYVDDLIKSCRNTDQAITLFTELSQLLQLGGFRLRKWSSNSPEVLSAIPAELQEIKGAISFDGSSSDFRKTLGLLWHPDIDVFKICVSDSFNSVDIKFTKRKVLSCICSVFDPLGFIAPVLISCKIIFQELWEFPLKWDELIPTSILDKWVKIYECLPSISSIAVPRFVLPNAECFQLHGFADASKVAYGACFYIRYCDSLGIWHSQLLCAKSRVTPRAQSKLLTGESAAVTIPRLELSAVLLLADLLTKVQTASDLMRTAPVHLWTDSSVVLSWLQSPPLKGNVFVRNRVKKILSSTSDCIWRHVASAMNPADLISRGVLPSLLTDLPLWWHGPPFLLGESDMWPNTTQFITPKFTFVSNYASKKVEEFQCLSRFSSHIKLVKVIAYVRRFIAICKLRCHCNDRSHCQNCCHLYGPLTVPELAQSKLSCCLLLQQSCFPRELAALRAQQELPPDSKLIPLLPFIHSDGLMRVLGRLQDASCHFNMKHPVILPREHQFTKSLISWTHVRLMHAGPSLVVSDIRQNYWVTSLRRLVKSVTRSCIKCFRQKPKSLQQSMGNLPSSRVQQSLPFQCVGVDYTGYFNIKQGGPRSKIIIKAYVALFICMCTKAVHIEIVTAMTAEAFIASFNRFVSRRGIPSKVFSDNATNFKRASHELNALFHLFNSQDFRNEVSEACLPLSIEWSFIPSRSPHMGGLWEANIKSFKYHLKRVMNSTSYSYEEFLTLATQVEAILNSRPLIKLNDDPHDFTFLTPGHFLIGRPLATLPYPSYDDISMNRLAKWQDFQNRIASLWKHWSRDYLHAFQQRQKWQTTSDNVKIGTPVILVDENAPTSQWKMGVITQLHPGKDGLARVVTVRTCSGNYKRHIKKLCPLPIEAEMS